MRRISIFDGCSTPLMSGEETSLNQRPPGKCREEERETDMTAPIPPADSATASTCALIVRLYGEINANRKGAFVPAGSPGDLDLARATETIVRCAGNADLSPTLALAEAEDLARAFADGDDGPFVRYGDGHSLPPTEESDLGVDEVLVLCASWRPASSGPGKRASWSCPPPSRPGRTRFAPRAAAWRDWRSCWASSVRDMPSARPAMPSGASPGSAVPTAVRATVATL